jgi:hypothetical protein
MCTDDQQFTTIVGPRRSLTRLLEILPRTTVAFRHHLTSRPTLIDLAAVPRDDVTPPGDFTHPYSPAVAVVFHEGSSSFAVADELQAELLVGNPGHLIDPVPDLLCEPGYLFGGTANIQGPNVTLMPNGVARMRSTAPTVSTAYRAAGARVAVLDTGVQGTGGAMLDFTVVPVEEKPWDDANGHGTAVATVISALNADASIHPLRVLGPATETGPSYQVLAGLAYALWSGSYDIVNASLTSTTSGPCELSLGTSIAYILRLCHTHSPNPVPLIVAAAGNASPKNCGYPARLPGAIVAIALEVNSAMAGSYRRASYNSIPPNHANEQEAYGGTETDPIGVVADENGSELPLYGTSFAAAAITAAYLP